MRTALKRAAVLTSVVVALAAPLGGPAQAETSAASPSASACPAFDAKAAVTGPHVAEIVSLTAKAAKRADQSLVMRAKVASILRDPSKSAKPGAVTVLVAPGPCMPPTGLDKGDTVLVVGLLSGSTMHASGMHASVIPASNPAVCTVHRELKQSCDTGATAPVAFTAANAAAPVRWLKLAAPGLAAIIVSVLGLFLLRLRRH